MAGKRAAVSVRSDAQARALNTLWQGIGIDALVMVGFGLTELMATGDPTSGIFWATIGILLVKSVLTALASFLVRLKFPATTPAPTPAPATVTITPVETPRPAIDPADYPSFGSL